MLNLKQVALSVKSDFNSKNRRKLAVKITKYQLALLLFFVVSTGVIYVGSITAPGQVSPALAGNTVDTSQMLSGQTIGLTLQQKRYFIDLLCSQLGGAYTDNRGGVIVESYDRYGNLIDSKEIRYGDFNKLLVEAGGRYKIMNAFGEIGKHLKPLDEGVQGFFEHTRF